MAEGNHPLLDGRERNRENNRAEGWGIRALKRI